MMCRRLLETGEPRWGYPGAPPKTRSVMDPKVAMLGNGETFGTDAGGNTMACAGAMGSAKNM